MSAPQVTAAYERGSLVSMSSTSTPLPRERHEPAGDDAAGDSGAGPQAVFIEPFDRGSHAAFARDIIEGVPARWTLLSMPGRNWKWRMRASAAQFALAHRDRLQGGVELVFATSYLPLAELVGLVPALGSAAKVLYFHENQFAFPVRREFTGGADLHFGLTQLVSALAADAVVFNSEHNRDTFLDGAEEALGRIRDAIPPRWVENVRARSHVLPLPVATCPPSEPGPLRRPPGHPDGPLIVWNHRWEHDKDPDAFVDALGALAAQGSRFRVALLGERFRERHPAFDRAVDMLGDRVVATSAPDREQYLAVLGAADLVVSTAIHEFFGVAVLEAMGAGVRPVVPDRLAYRETVPDAFRYHGALVDALAPLVARFHAGEPLRGDYSAALTGFAPDVVMARYTSLCVELVAARRAFQPPAPDRIVDVHEPDPRGTR